MKFLQYITFSINEASKLVFIQKCYVDNIDVWLN